MTGVQTCALPICELKEPIDNFDLALNFFKYIYKLEEARPEYKPLIDKFRHIFNKKDMIPHDILDTEELFFSEDQLFDFLIKKMIEMTK